MSTHASSARRAGREPVTRVLAVPATAPPSESLLPRSRHTLILAAAITVGMLSIVHGQTALDNYVAAPDAYSTVGLGSTYALVRTVAGSGYTGYVLNMNSQTWRTTADVNRIDWQHWLTVIAPDTVSTSKAMLFITGGSNGGSAPSSVDGTLASFATATGSVVAELRTVPNQPLYFTDEVNHPRYEDAIISYTYDKYLNNPTDDTWPLLEPMVKSAVRAMDTVEDYVPTIAPGSHVDRFVVSGVSKRGWTTWLTAANDALAAAEDRRVEAIMPVVIDVANIDEQMEHHRRAYENVTQNMVGGYSDAVHDYVDMNVIDRLGTPTGQLLLDIVDPVEYRQRLTLPKFLVNSTGDEFFLPDSSQFYFDDMPGQKYLRYVPNTNHGSAMGAASTSMLAFYQAIVDDGGASLPEFSWTVEDDGSIRVQTVDAPAAVHLWQATNSTTRDFQQRHIGSAWTSSTLTTQGDGSYVGELPDPGGTGWTAFFVELVYDNGAATPLTFTTDVSVVPFRRTWINPAGGAIDDGTNWAKQLPLFARDTATFNLAADYQVTMAGDLTTRRVVIGNDHVTLALGGTTYRVTSAATADPSIVVGAVAGDDGRLTIADGTLAGVQMAVGKIAGADGRVTVAAGGTLEVSGAAFLGGSTAGAGGTGWVTVQSGGAVEVAGDMTVWPAGMLKLAGGAATAARVDLAGGTLAGVGTVAGDLDNGGLVTPAGTAGILAVAGDFSQSAAGTLRIEIGAGPGGESGLLDVDGTATLDGTLAPAWIGPPEPALGDTFTVVSAGAVDGVFAAVDDSAATLGQTPAGFPLDWLVDYSRTDRVELLAGVRGDMDWDGDVDFDDVNDFVLGLSSRDDYLTIFDRDASVAGDQDGDFDLDFDDIPAFVALIAAGSADTQTAQAVAPEPTALALAIIGLFGLSGWRRPRRNTPANNRAA